MRNFLVLSLFICLISRAITRPSRWDQRNAPLDQTDDREAEEVEYENNEENAADDPFQEDEEASLNDQGTRDTEPGQDEEQVRGDDASRAGQQINNLNKEKYMPHALAEDREEKPSNDHLMDEYSQKNKEEKVDEEASSSNDPSLPKRRQANIFSDSSELIDSENTQHLNVKSNRIQNDVRDDELDKRTVDTHRIPLDEHESLFDNQKMHRNSADKREYHKDDSDSSEQSHRLKQYNTIQSDHKSMLRDRNYEMPQFMLNRDRRQAEVSDTLSLTSTSTEKESLISDTANEDDEAAIKRHIKKLSGEELEELLNSLSDEKKALLNKIMDSNHNYDSLNKREITKKAGAVEENNYIDGGLSDLSKLQSVSSSIEGNTESAIGQSSDTDNTKQEGQTESSDASDAKVPETTRTEVSENKELVDSVDAATNNINLIANEDAKDIISSNSQPAKSENKREVNSDYFNNQADSFDDTQFSENDVNVRDSEDPFNEQDHSCASQEDDLSQIMDEEAELHHNQEFKREALADNEEELDDSIRSLEESFPKSDSEESGQYIESNMTPLIRVKRKDENREIQKRAAAVVPDGKVAFVPYKAENDDEDNDEGNEFDDDGFYDRTANFAKSNMNSDDLAPANFAAKHLGKKKLSESSAENKLDSDSTSLGSDSDGVLSGVEGVDENLMFSSGARNRRARQESLEQLTEEESKRGLRSTPSADDFKPENHINIPHYQENDAFGALPRNYEGELGRYKRIRRVKPSSDVVKPDD